MLRQGDVQFVKVEIMPENVLPREGNLLFKGEATGHAHVVDGGEIFEFMNGLLYLRAEKTAHVTHEEHKTVSLPPGLYLVSQKRQYDTVADWKSVQD